MGVQVVGGGGEGVLKKGSNASSLRFRLRARWCHVSPSANEGDDGMHERGVRSPSARFHRAGAPLPRHPSRCRTREAEACEIPPPASWWPAMSLIKASHLRLMAFLMETVSFFFFNSVESWIKWHLSHQAKHISTFLHSDASTRINVICTAFQCEAECNNQKLKKILVIRYCKLLLRHYYSSLHCY